MTANPMSLRADVTAPAFDQDWPGLATVLDWFKTDIPNGVHPALDVIPMMTNAEFTSLVGSIRTIGLLHPILVTADGQLLDGRHRLMACYVAKQEPRFHMSRMPGDPWDTVWSLNVARASYSPEQIRAVMAAVAAGSPATVAVEQSALLTAALGYAASGLPVFPCVPGAKHPITAHGFKDGTTDLDQIRRWWTATPEANIGVPTGAGTFDVLDVDVKGVGDQAGFVALAKLARAGLVKGSFRTVNTPSGGAHLYFRPSGNTSTTKAKHRLDVRGAGGYVVVPPSTVNGRAYVIHSDDPTATGTLDWPACLRLLDPPRSLVRASTPPRSIGPKSTRPGKLAHLVNWVGKQPEGNRNSGLYWACCQACKDGVEDLAPLIAAGVEVGLTEAEARATAASARFRMVASK